MSETTQANATHSSPQQRELPSGWRWVQLGEVCEINPRRSDITRRDMEPTSFVPMETVDAARGVISEIRERPFADVKKGYTYFEDGDVLFAKITPCMQNGKHAIARNLIEGIGFASTEFHVIRPAKGILAEWIHYYIRQPAVLQDATYHFTGAVGQQRVPDDFLKCLEIPLPPLSEQRRIAGVLHEQMAAVEKARAAAQARLEAVKSLPAAFLRQVFPQPGQPLPAGWRWVKLGEVCDGPGQYGTSTKSNGDQRGVPVLGMYHIHEGRIRWENVSYVDLQAEELPKYLLLKGDLLFNRTNSAELVGKTAVYDTDKAAVFASYLIRFRFIEGTADSRFISAFINSGEGRRFIAENMARAIGQVNISASTMRMMPIPLPPLPEQKRISASLKKQITAVETVRAVVEEKLATINALPAALLRRAFNGEL